MWVDIQSSGIELSGLTLGAISILWCSLSQEEKEGCFNISVEEHRFSYF
jgi:hypothetical protein